MGADGSSGIWEAEAGGLALQADSGTQAPPVPKSTRAGPGGESMLRGREKAFLASQSRDRTLDLAVLLTHLMTLEKSPPSSLGL